MIAGYSHLISPVVEWHPYEDLTKPADRLHRRHRICCDARNVGRSSKTSYIIDVPAGKRKHGETDRLRYSGRICFEKIPVVLW